MALVMARACVLASVVAAVPMAGCKRSEEPASTPLPTRQTTIDPVKKKLETAAEDAEARRRAVDEATK